ncbi:ABC transporter ATP-binding protein [Nesterenkonia flava]|uniref:ABC transporter ATP-binding protein n=1 Tax=Nesterenkonia flava TaxID=469799 RepID=A0ABU1FX99_9MICC|nr:ABC transporter ATP-binding protein [Nesterenkonia flava]MDR5712967.1 ABC transporter ATP-binding protein [Nesterenkonia flava]
MTAAIEVRHLTRRHGDTLALDGVTTSFEEHAIHGLLGRNGAGKSTLMSLITGQDFPTSGEVQVFGQAPHENEHVLSRISFIREAQRYFDDFKARHAFSAAADAYPHWDQNLAEELAEEFRVPEKTRIKKMSHGQRSAVGVITGIASRAELTLFDEPYVGLDAVARQLFYDRLLADYAEHPRTVIISSHLIDEISHLIENVVLIDQGKLLLDEPAEQLRGRAVTLVGPAHRVREAVGTRTVLSTEQLGRTARTTVMGGFSDAERAELHRAEIDITPVSLQQLVVHLTTTRSTTSEEAVR